MLKIRRPLGRLIFNMGIAIPGKTVFLIETAPWESCIMVRGQYIALLPLKTMMERGGGVGNTFFLAGGLSFHKNIGYVYETLMFHNISGLNR